MGTYQPQQDLSAFGEQEVVQITPVIQVQFPYNINAEMVHAHANQSGTVTQADNMAKLQSGAATSSSAEFVSRITAKYNPGQGTIWRGTAVFTTGVSGNTQYIGVGNDDDGFFFGFQNSTFGIMHRKGGTNEVRTLTVSTKSSTSEDITITLDGDAKTDVAVTNGADKTVTANEIAAADYTDVGRGWDTFAIGDTVVFISWADTARSGTYSLSDSGGAAGSFAQTVAGVTATDTFVAQADWNVDAFDGSGNANSGVTLDPTKGNVYEIQYQWLGFGDITFSVEHSATGRFVIVHRIQFANANTTPSINNPTLPCYAGTINTTNSSNITLNIGSMMMGTEGIIIPSGFTHGAAATGTLTGISTETPILSLCNVITFQSKVNRVVVKILLASLAVEHTKPVQLKFYRNPTLVAASFSAIDSETSVIHTDTSATSLTGGTLLFAVELGKTGNQIINIINEDVGIMEPGDIITVTALPNSGNGAEADISLNFLEEH